MKKIMLVMVMLLSPIVSASQLSPPFTNAVRVGNILYLSGQIGSVRPGQPPLVEGGIEPETRQAMNNIKQVLEENGSTLNQVFKCTVMMADMKEWPLMNDIYASYFLNGKYPARSAFGATALALNARVEIECMAIVINRV